MPTQIDTDKLNDITQKRKYDQTAPPLKGLMHQEYPKCMYLWAKDKKIHPLHGNMIEKDATNQFVSVTDFSKTDGSRVKIVNSADEEKALRAKGFRDRPHMQEFDEPVPEGFEAELPEVAPRLVTPLPVVPAPDPVAAQPPRSATGDQLQNEAQKKEAKLLAEAAKAEKKGRKAN